MRCSFLMPGVLALVATAACGSDPPGVVYDVDVVVPGDANDVPDAKAPLDVEDAADASDAADATPVRMCQSNDDCTAPDLCANAQVCRNNRCITIGGAANCDDGIACTNDRCDESMGRCLHEADDAR